MQTLRNPARSAGPAGPVRARRPRRRRGVITLEFLLVFPLLWIATLAIFQFGILLLVTQAVTSSVIEGARQAAEVAATPESVAERVQDFLAVHCITFDTTDSGSGAAYGNALVVIEYGEITIDRPDEMTLSLQGFMFGNTDIPCELPPDPPGENQVRVTVCTPVTDTATGCKPVPDWLDYFGFTLQGCVFEVRSLANME